MQLHTINKNLTNNLSKFGQYTFKPHVSLIYKKMSHEEKQKIVDAVNIKNNFEIDRICIQKFSENIENWKIVKEYQLQ